MATLEIKKYPDSILKKKCQEVKEITPEIKELVLNMAETMLKKQGIGLAAPQVGVLKRVIVVATKRGVQGLINPKILRKSKETEVINEGCLSFPGLYLRIKRPKWVEAEALDIYGQKIHWGQGELLSASSATERYSTSVILSRVIQHEIDHLDGVLFIDRISFWQKLKIRKKLKEFEKTYGSHR